MQSFACLLGIAVSGLDTWILKDRTVLAGAVNLHQILINHTSGTDVQVTYLRISHLSVRQPYILTGSLKLGMCTDSVQIVEIRGWSAIDNITVTVFSDAPSVEDHQ